MNNESAIFNSYVIKSILSNNEFGITEIMELESLKSILVDFTKYAEIKHLIRAGKIELLKDSLNNSSDFSEYVEIMRFSDQNNNSYMATIYDSDELWQNPEVIDIFPA